jgi:2-polyprenyl-3-methyl-5-hydroxy-6-metoxy-1,4-benzoquinol methylase
MIDNKFFFDKSVELGFTDRHYETLVKLHTNGARVLQIMGCKSVFEFGSGLGFFLSACHRIGLYNYMGYDINPYERDFAISKGIEPTKYILAKYVTKYHLGRFELKPKGRYDAIYSTEVFEHMTDEQISFVMPILYKACNKYFYFTSTPHASPDPAFDIEWGHINLKTKEQWIALFARFGFDFLRDAYEVTSWGLLFVKK